MAPEVILALPEGERALRADELPVLLGSGADSHIRLPGPPSAPPAASINLLDDRALVQCSAGVSGLQLNGQAVSGARWLSEGDRLSIAGAEVAVDSVSPQAMRLTVRYLAQAWDTRPPELADEAESGESIRAQRPAADARLVRSRKGGLWLRVTAALALAVLAASALFVFAAEGVLIEVVPPEANVEVDGALVVPHIGPRYLLWKGEYRVRAELARHHPLDERIEVLGGGDEAFRFDLRLLPGRVVVDSVDGGEIRLEGVEGVFTPGEEIALEPGTWALSVSAPRYKELNAPLTVEGGGERETFAAELEPDWAAVTVSSEPAGAEIRSENALLGTTPATVELLSGQRLLAFSRPGFATHREALTVVAGSPQVLPTVRLQPAAGALRVLSDPPGASITVNGEFRGGTPATVEVAPDRAHRVVVARAGYESQERIVTLARGAEQSLNIRLEPRLGTIRVLSRPEGAAVLVNGEAAGHAPIDLQLPATEHELEFRREGYVAQQRKVVPQPAYPQEVAVELLTPQEHRLAQQPAEIETSQGAGMVMLFPGEFEMGSPRGSQGWRSNEVRRKVRITKRYYLGVKEVTNREFKAFVPTHTSGAERFRALANESSPAVNVDWQAAAAFCNWLSSQEGLPLQYQSRAGRLIPVDEPGTGYRLPSEAEWVWAARYQGGAGSSRYPWGERMPPPPRSGNYADQSASGLVSNVLAGYNDNFPFTAKAGSFPANLLELHDLGGNAAEWMGDYYSTDTLYPGVEVDPRGPREGRFNVIRGSSWLHGTLRELRWAFRDFGGEERVDVGFRLARHAQLQEQE